MSIESMIVAHHKNKIEAGRTPKIDFCPPNDRTPADFWVKKFVLQFVCIGYGLIKVGEMAIRRSSSES